MYPSIAVLISIPMLYTLLSTIVPFIFKNILKTSATEVIQVTYLFTKYFWLFDQLLQGRKEINPQVIDKCFFDI